MTTLATEKEFWKAQMGSKSRSAKGRSRAVRLGLMPECSEIVVFKRHLSYCKTLSESLFGKDGVRAFCTLSRCARPSNAEKLAKKPAACPTLLQEADFDTGNNGNSRKPSFR